MAGLFDEFARSFESENEEEGEQNDAVSQAVVESLEEDDGIDEEFSEAERLLAKAAYYKAIARNGVVEDDGTPQATEVNAESRVWAREQMGKMLGRSQPKAAPIESVFTPNEVMALKKLAGFTLAKMGEPVSEPVVKTVSAPVAPQVRKVQSQLPPKQVAKPVAPKAPAAKASKPAAKPGAKKTPARVSKSSDGKPDYSKMPNGEVFKDVDGQLYKMVDNPNFDPDRKGSKPRTKLKVTNQVRGQGAFPTPTREQMSAITAAQSQDTINVGASASATSPFGSDKQAGQDVFILAAAGSLKNE
jgi:hypothetical protein